MTRVPHIFYDYPTGENTIIEVYIIEDSATSFRMEFEK